MAYVWAHTRDNPTFLTGTRVGVCACQIAHPPRHACGFTGMLLPVELIGHAELAWHHAVLQNEMMRSGQRVVNRDEHGCKRDSATTDAGQNISEFPRGFIREASAAIQCVITINRAEGYISGHTQVDVR